MSALTDALPLLSIVAGGVIALAAFGRDSKADEHDLSDYHEPATELDELKQRIIAGLKRGGPAVVLPPTGDDILPPAPPGMNAGIPLYAGMLFDTWHPESPAVTAARFLRELGEQARAGLAVA